MRKRKNRVKKAKKRIPDWRSYRPSTASTRIYRMYVLESLGGGNRTYVGVTHNMERRLLQHNRKLTGGARATAGHQWHVAAIVGNFASDAAALSVEKTMHLKGGKWGPASDGRLSPLLRRLACLRRTLEAAEEKFAGGRPSVKIFNK